MLFTIHLFEKECDILVGELAIDGSKSIRSAFYVGLVFAVQVHLKNALSISLHAGSLSDNFSGIDNVV